MKDLTGRAKRLELAIAKTRLRLKNAPHIKWLGGGAAKKHKLQLTNRLEELETSLYNIQTYGFEVMPTGNPIGTEIGVPAAGRKDDA